MRLGLRSLSRGRVLPAALAGQGAALQPGREQKSLFALTLPTLNPLPSKLQNTFSAGSWSSAFETPLASAFLVSRVMLWCLLLLYAPHCRLQMPPTPATVYLSPLWLHGLLKGSWSCLVSCNNGTQSPYCNAQEGRAKVAVETLTEFS